MLSLKCENITYGYQPEVEVLRGVSLQMTEGEICGLLGRSGVGKTTLLNIIGGYLQPTAGTVSFNGELVRGPSWFVQPMYQEDSLWPWLTILDNVLLANRFGGRHRSKRRKHQHFSKSEAEAVLQSVGLGAGTWGRWPKELSVGMRKRVELARMFLYRPKLILADEPFAALDVLTKRQLIKIILSARESHRLTVLFSSHDIDDMMQLCKRVFILAGVPSAKIVATVENLSTGIASFNNGIEYSRHQTKEKLIQLLQQSG